MPAVPPADRLLGAGLIHDKVQVQGRRILDCYALVHLLGGVGWFESDGVGRMQVAAGDCLVLFPGLAHGYGPDRPGDWAEGWILAAGPGFARLEAEGVLDRRAPLWRVGGDPAIAQAFAGLHADQARAGEADRAWLATRALALAADLARRHRLLAQQGRGTAFIAEACALLGENLGRPLDLDKVAVRYGLSLERFRKVFAAEMGVPPARFRLAKRIARAQALLIEGRLDLAGIAAELGFCDVYQFNRMFRRHAGVAPGRWRRSAGDHPAPKRSTRRIG
jgi:AraC-like DNA-binding protein